MLRFYVYLYNDDVMTLRSKLKKALPKKLVYYYALVSAIRAYMHDIRIRAYDKVYNASDAEKLKRDLTVNYHIIEKGLTMPEPRPGFGKQVVFNVVDYILRYDRMNLPKDAVMFVQSVSVIKEYLAYHKKIGHDLDQEVQAKTALVTESFPEIDGQKQIRTSRDEYLEHIGGTFDQFCRSRYSVRHYSDQEVPLAVLQECIEMAQRSPSFCNRQPNRVHIVKNDKTKEAVLALQNGNRGFGHLGRHPAGNHLYRVRNQRPARTARKPLERGNVHHDPAQRPALSRAGRLLTKLERIEGQGSGASPAFAHPWQRGGPDRHLVRIPA